MQLCRLCNAATESRVLKLVRHTVQKAPGWEVQALGAVYQLLLRQLVLHHELRQVPHHLPMQASSSE